MELSNFDENALSIARRQYFQEGETTLEEVFRRVAKCVASVEKSNEKAFYEEQFYSLMAGKRFCPGGRVLAGAGTKHGNILNCFVQDGSPMEVGTTSRVMHLAKKLALVTKVGGGNGLCLDEFLPKKEFTGKVGKLYITCNSNHPDYQKVLTGTYKDLVIGEYVQKGYRFANFISENHLMEKRIAGDSFETIQPGDSIKDIWESAACTVYELISGFDVVVDLSKLRKEGAEVQGSGGNSSGPSSFAVEVFDNFGYWASLGGG